MRRLCVSGRRAWSRLSRSCKHASRQPMMLSARKVRCCLERRKCGSPCRRRRSAFMDWINWRGRRFATSSQRTRNWPCPGATPSNLMPRLDRYGPRNSSSVVKCRPCATLSPWPSPLDCAPRKPWQASSVEFRPSRRRGPTGARGWRRPKARSMRPCHDATHGRRRSRACRTRSTRRSSARRRRSESSPGSRSTSSASVKARWGSTRHMSARSRVWRTPTPRWRGCDRRRLASSASEPPPKPPARHSNLA